MDHAVFFTGISWQDSIWKVIAEHTCLLRDNPLVHPREHLLASCVTSVGHL